MTKQLRSIGPLSCAKVSAVVYGVIGLIAGGFVSLLSFLVYLAATSRLKLPANRAPRSSAFYSVSAQSFCFRCCMRAWGQLEA